MPMYKLAGSRIITVTVQNFVGDKGIIFWDETTGDLRLGDGITPGGIRMFANAESLPVSTGGGTGAIINVAGSVPNVNVSPPNNPQTTLNAAFSTATSGTSVIDSATGDLWVKGDNNIWIDAGRVLGYTGSRGDLGYTGSIGFSGSRGFTGSIGYTGSQGDFGYTGSQGVQGPAGTSVRIIGSLNYSYDLDINYGALPGTQPGDGFIITQEDGELWVWDGQGWNNVGKIRGPQGFFGSRGYTGSLGYTGSASTASGYIGSTGYTGSASTASGYIGSTGYTGSLGYTGSASTASGYVGSTGYTGSTGDDGVYVGSAPPPNTDILWLDTTALSTTSQYGPLLPPGGVTGQLLVKASNDNYNLIWQNAPAGTGETGGGYIGSTGFVGSQGLPGFVGSASTATGFTGSTGSTGTQGIIGFTGSTGTQGTIGFTGSFGFTGSRGPATAIQSTDDSTSTLLYPVMVNAGGTEQVPKINTSKLFYDSAAGIFTVVGEIVAQKLTIEYTTITTTLVKTDDIIQTSNTTIATSTDSGALVIAGGIGVGGGLYVGNTSTFVGAILPSVSDTYDLGSPTARFKTLYVSSSTIDLGGTRLSGSADGSFTVNKASITEAAISTSTTTGALVVAGGVGIGGSVYAGPIYDSYNRVVTKVNPSGSDYIGITNLISTGTSTAFTIVNLGVQTLTAGTDTAISSNTGTVTVWNTSTLQTVTNRGASTNNKITITNATSASSTTEGALIVSGGAAIAGGLYVGNTSTFVGAILPSVSNTYDLGSPTARFKTLYISSATIDIGGATLSGTTETGITISKLNVTTASISNFTGDSFNISGDQTIKGNLIVGSGNIYTTSTSASLFDTTATTINFGSAANNITIGAITGYTQVRNVTKIINNTASTSTTTGALVVSGGVGITGDLYISGTIYKNGVTVTDGYSGSVGFTGSIGFTGSTGDAGISTIIVGSVPSVNPDPIYTDVNIRGALPGVDFQIGNGVIDENLGDLWIYNSGVSWTNVGRIKGDIGFTGSVGDTGYWGSFGYSGSQGIIGYTGSQGSTGSTGTQGVIGFTGSQGIIGYTGSTGTTGTQGVIGFTGSQGIIGYTGSTGNTGTQGVIGFTGSIGSFTGTTAQVVNITNVSSAISTTTGALIVAGGAGIAGDLYVGNSATVLSTLASTSSVQNNALYVAGGLGVATSLLVTGPAVFQNSVTFSGTSTFVYSTNTYYTDNLINIHVPQGSTGTDHTWTVDDSKDIGFVYHYYKGQDKDAFLGLANDSGYLEWYSNGTEVGGIFTGTEYGIFKTGGIILTNTTASNSTSTGALTVAGGAAIGKGLYIGDNIYTPNNNTGLVAGVSSQPYSGSFNGSTQYLIVPSNAVFAFGTGDFTVEAWFYYTGAQGSSWQGIIGGGGTGNSIFELRLENGNLISWWLDGPGNQYYGSSSISVNTWYHIALVRSGSSTNNTKVYLNGVLESQATLNNNLSAQPVVIGRGYTDYNGEYFTGYISNVRIVKGLAVYTSNFTVPSLPFLATQSSNTNGNPSAAIPGSYTSLLTLQNSTIIDNSTNGFTITNNGTVTTTQAVSPSLGNFTQGTFKFNGSSWQATPISITGDLNVSGVIYRNGISVGYGYTGSNGFTGSIGFTGSQGITGYTGSLGYIGSTGYTGSTGTQGVIGYTGSAGSGGGGSFDGSSIINITNTTASTSTNSGALIVAGGVGIGKELYIGSNIYIPNTNVGLVGGIIGSGSAYTGVFSGNNISFPSDASFNYGTGDFTIETWAYWSSAKTGNETIYEGAGAQRIIFGISTTGIRLYNGAGEIGQTYSFSTNTWYHIAIVRSGSTITFYVNGTSVGTAANSTNWTFSQHHIGVNYDGNEPYTGRISNFRIVKGVAVYTANFTAPTSGLTSTQSSGVNISAITGVQTSILTLQNSTIIDNSTNAFTLTNNGGVTTSLVTVPFASSTVQGTFSYDGTKWQATALQTTNLTVSSDLNVSGIIYRNGISVGYGYNGSIGYTGSTGFGYTGSTGTQGVIGYTGSAGSGGGGSFDGSSIINITNTTSSTSTTTGALVISGGVGVGGNIYSGGTITALTAAITGLATIAGLTDFNSASSVEYLIVAGGGGGGSNYGGGGGAGGYRTASGLAISAGTYAVTVGAGGTGNSQNTTYATGNPSQFSTVISAAGGGGGYNGGPGQPGGSGGGAPYYIQTGGAASPAGQGNAGGASDPSQNFGGGGGGAGAVGYGGGHATYPGVGGIGLESSISGTPIYYAGGGGAWTRSTGQTSGGLGGGGAGRTSSNYANMNATENTGGGGGATDYGSLSGNGGSGIIIIRYSDTYSPASSATGSVTYTVSGGYRVYIFTSSGTISFGGAADSSGPTSGSLVVTGGVGVGGNLNVAGTISASNFQNPYLTGLFYN